MSQGKRFAYKLAVVGFVVTAALFTYLEATDYRPLEPLMVTVSLILCPASVLSAGFLDIGPHSVEAVLAWLFIALINGALYGLIGYVIGVVLTRHRTPRQAPD